MRKNGINLDTPPASRSAIEKPTEAAPLEVAGQDVRAELNRLLDESPLSAEKKDALRVMAEEKAKPKGGLRSAGERLGISRTEAMNRAREAFKEFAQHLSEKTGRELGRGAKDYKAFLKALAAEGQPDRPAASESAALAMLQDKIASNAPGEKVSFGARANATPPAETPAQAVHLRESAVRLVQKVKDWFGRMGGQTAPRTTRLSEKSGDAIARLGAARQYATALAPDVLDRILPHNPEEPSQSGGWARDVVGGVMVEDSLRHMRQVHLTNGDTEAANRVGTIIGSHRTAADWEANPFKTERDYQELRSLPWVQEAIKRYEKEYVPLKEQYFRTAQGMDPNEAIDSLTQIPGRPIFRLHLPEGETRFNGGGEIKGRGNITAQRARKLGQAREASGTGYYEIDLGKIIEGDLSRLIPNSAKAELYRTMEKDGIGAWAEPGTTPHEGWEKIPDVRPPKGTQEAEKGQIDFWVHPDAYNEVRQVLGVDQPASPLPLAGALAKATLASTVEAAYHTRNLISLLTRPGMNPLTFIKNVRDVIAKDAETMRRISKLTEIGAMKEHGFESATVKGGYRGGLLNPVNLIGKGMDWSARAMTVVDRAMRLTADHAFDVLAKRPGVDGSEGARRDFINQLGNYNKRTQPKLIAWLRDTGLGPFATAGSNFYMQGLRALVMGHGVRTTSRQADLLLRAEGFLRMATLPAIAAGLNYLLWDRFDGDDKTPIGGVKIGESDGKTSYLDFGAMIPLIRGMRETGLLAAAEGMRPGATARGATTGDWIDHAFHDVALSALHPAIGPPVSFVHTLLTGENTMGAHVAPYADMKKGESQSMLNAYAALFSVNPVLESWVKPLVSEQAGFKEKKEPADSEKLFKMLGPFGVKNRSEAPGAPRRSITVPVLSKEQRATQPKKKRLGQ